ALGSVMTVIVRAAAGTLTCLDRCACALTQLVISSTKTRQIGDFMFPYVYRNDWSAARVFVENESSNSVARRRCLGVIFARIIRNRIGFTGVVVSGQSPQAFGLSLWEELCFSNRCITQV